MLSLDPYGMQVEWATIEAVAKTKAIDLWLLFPLGIGVNRLLTKSGEIREAWRRRLDLLFGTEDWYEECYKIRKARDLFGNEIESLEKEKMETVGRYFNDRLKGIFAGVVDEPGVLPGLNLAGMDWVIVGGASGPQSRPMDPEWVTDLRNQSRRATVPFFFKQWGGRNKKKAGRELEGRTWDEMPSGSAQRVARRQPAPALEWSGE